VDCCRTPGILILNTLGRMSRQGFLKKFSGSERAWVQGSDSALSGLSPAVRIGFPRGPELCPADPFLGAKRRKGRMSGTQRTHFL
jgi:hypothetical protein